jgi:hypothetical protein
MRAVDKNQSDPLSELTRLDETELKAAIKSAWKKCERLARKEMGPLLYSLRLTLRASANEISFGDWVETNLFISQRTAHQWAEEFERSRVGDHDV